jgi:hypothetical protein
LNGNLNLPWTILVAAEDKEVNFIGIEQYFVVKHLLHLRFFRNARKYKLFYVSTNRIGFALLIHS